MRPDIEFLLLFGGFTFLVGFVFKGSCNDLRVRRNFHRGYAQAVIDLAPELPTIQDMKDKPKLQRIK